MTAGDFIGWVLGGLGLVVTVMARILSSQGGRIDKVSDKHDTLSREVSRAQLYSAQNYATKSELKISHDAIVQRLDRIYDKLDQKADR